MVEKHKIRYVMVYFVDNCIDCKGCMVACKAEWNVPGDYFRNHIDQVEVNFGKDAYKTYFLASQCNHCENPPCVSVCPTTASFKTDKGMVDIDETKCIGCKYCIVSCPYNARYFNEIKQIADKCSFCMPRVEAGFKPACVETCITSARIFGDINDPNSEVSIALKDAVKHKAKIWQLRADLGTNPSIYYIQKA